MLQQAPQNVDLPEIFKNHPQDKLCNWFVHNLSVRYYCNFLCKKKKKNKIGSHPIGQLSLKLKKAKSYK